MSDWIRPKRVLRSVDETTHVLIDGATKYAVVRATINTDSFDPASALSGSLQLETMHGPFEIGPLSIGRIVQADALQVEADWYFKLY